MTAHKLFPPSRALHCIEVTGQQYKPSNGSEGEAFIGHWCGHCARDKSAREGAPIEECDDREVCPIIARSFAGDATEWVYGTDGQPRCTEYVEHGQPIPYRCPNTPDIFGDAP